MFKKPNKKFFVIRRVVVSIVATVAVLIIVTASILFMLGYRLDGGNGRLEQGALLQFDSTPNNANVYVDGALLGSQTATKQTVIAGEHSVKLTKTGYEDWNRTLMLDAGTLTWLDYVRLVPKERTPEAVAQYKTLAAMSFSPDLKWALAIEDAASPTFQLIDLRSEAIKTSPLVLPATLYTSPTDPMVTSKFSIYRWNSNGRYVIMQHSYGTQVEWLMVDTQDISKSVNISSLLSVGFTDVQFSGTSGTSLYGLASDGIVRKLDTSAATISRPLITNVTTFSVFEDTNTLSYSGQDPNDTTKKVVGIYKDGESNATILQTAKDATKPLTIALGRYFSDNFVAIAEDAQVTILTGTLPSAGATENSSLTPYASLSLSSGVSELSFSPKGDYVIAQSGTQFASYEIEHKRGVVTPITNVEGQKTTPLEWLTIAQLWNDTAGSLVMRDFDGTNAHAIMPVASGFGSTLSTNGKFFYAVGKTDDGYQLQRVRMILN